MSEIIPTTNTFSSSQLVNVTRNNEISYWSTQRMPVFKNSFNTDDDDGDDDDNDDDSDPDLEAYKKFLGMDLANYKYSSISDQQKMYAKFQSTRPPDIQETVFVVIAVLGLMLNCALFIAQLRLPRHTWRLRNQRSLISLLALAHALQCAVHTIEFCVLLLGAGGLWTSCLQLLKKRYVKSFSSFIVIGAITGCSVDNYIAVCQPILHRIRSNEISIIFFVIFPIYIIVALLISFSEFLFPFREDIECMSSSLFGENANNKSLSRFLPFLQLSANEVKSYCKLIDDCHHQTAFVELAIMAVWVLSLFVVSFSYISVVVRLRKSLNFSRHSDENCKSTQLMSRPSTNERFVLQPQKISTDGYMGATSNDGASHIANDSNQRLSIPRLLTQLSLLGRLTVPSATPTTHKRANSISYAKQLVIMRRRQQLANALVIILIVFIITWLPFVSFQIANEFFFTENFRVTMLRRYLPITALLEPFQMTASVLDPIVYIFTYGNSRKCMGWCTCKKPVLQQ